MRAIVHKTSPRFEPAYADPNVPADHCLIKVILAGICSTDQQIIRGYMGFSGVLGHEMVGVVQEGPARWSGKRVVSEINCVCGSCDMCAAGLSNHCRKRTVMGIAGRDGCFADYVVMPARNLHEVPDVISDEEAVFVEPLAAAIQVVRQVPIEKRAAVAVVGGGKLGLLVAQVISTIGCRLEVVCRNPRSVEFCEKKHIQAVSVDDVMRRNDRDVVIECSGSPAGLDTAMHMVRPRGTIVLKSTYHVDSQALPIDLAPVVINEVTVVGSRCGPFQDAINALAAKQIDVTSLITRSFDLEHGVDALAAATSPEHFKVLLKINPR